PTALKTLLYLMGDGASLNGGSDFVVTVDETHGYGHLRFVNLDTELGSTAGWGLQLRTLTEGEVVEWPVGSTGPESSLVTGWKFVAVIDDNRYTDSPDIRFDLVDRCPATGGVTVVRTAARTALRARMRMRASE